MRTSLQVFLRRLSGFSILLGCTSLIVAMLLSAASGPASAADSSNAGAPASLATWTPVVSCTPPDDWGQTVRLVYDRQVSKEWTFEVGEPEMYVNLEFFFYQDYDRNGCPFDCSTGDCQLDEVGQGESPLGSFHIEDGQLGAHHGAKHVSGNLAQGTYTARFGVTAHGSINIGMRVHRSSLPTDTPVPSETPTPTSNGITSTATPTETSTVAPPTATHTVTPTASPTASDSATPTATATGPVIPPLPSNTPTPTERPPKPSHTPTATSPSQPPVLSPTAAPTRPAEAATATATGVIIMLQTPVGTLPPPTPPSGFIQPPIIVPVTGAESSAGAAAGGLIPIFLNVGIGLLGFGLVALGLSRRVNRHEDDLGNDLEQYPGDEEEED